MTFFGLKLGLDLEMREAHPHQKFQGVPPPRPLGIYVIMLLLLSPNMLQIYSTCKLNSDHRLQINNIESVHIAAMKKSPGNADQMQWSIAMVVFLTLDIPMLQYLECWLNNHHVTGKLQTLYLLIMCIENK